MTQYVKGTGSLNFQARYVAVVDQVLPQTIDPAMGRIHERRFVPSEEINNFVKWGNTGEEKYTYAVEVWNGI